MRPDILLTGLIVLLAAWGVAGQLGFDPFSEPPAPLRPLAMGERLELDLVLSDAAGRPREPLQPLGRAATVLYTWSVPCPCIDVLEPRLSDIHERFADRGVRWIAFAGEPKDTRQAVRAKMERLGVFYDLLLDPEQQVCRRLGLVHAAQVAVLDGEGRLVYRGAVDADYDEGKGEYLAEALAAAVGGRPAPVPERDWVYGCEFDVPESCLEYERPDRTVPAGDS